MFRARSRYGPVLALALIALLCSGVSLSAATPTPKPPPRTAVRNTIGTPYGIGIFRVVSAVGVWALRSTPTAGDPTTTFVYGQQGDVPLMCDWDGNGTRTPGIFRNGLWGIRNSNSTGNPDASFYFGQAGDIPVCGDWTGQGKQTVGLFRVVNGQGLWLLRNSNDTGNPDIAFSYGQTGDQPIVGDWIGQGKQTIAVYRGYSILYRYSNSGGGPDAGLGGIGNTYPTSLAFSGDWTGQGKEIWGEVDDYPLPPGGPPTRRVWGLGYSNTQDGYASGFFYGNPGDLPLVYK